MIILRNKNFSEKEEEKKENTSNAIKGGIGAVGVGTGGYLMSKASKNLEKDLLKAELDRDTRHSIRKQMAKDLKSGKLNEAEFGGFKPKSAEFRYKLNKGSLKEDLKRVTREIERDHGKDLAKALKKNKKANLIAGGATVAGATLLGNSLVSKKKKK